MKDYYSQSSEQENILKFFTGKTGSLLDIGANDGIENSNSRALLELGWRGALVEPHPGAFANLSKNHISGTIVFECAITDYDGEVEFHHCPDSQISSTKEEFTRQWKKAGAKYDLIKVDCMSVKTLLESASGKFVSFDFITIDAEGCDFSILKQLSEFDFTGAKMICIECSGDERKEINQYLTERGFIFYHSTDENLLMIR